MLSIGGWFLWDIILSATYKTPHTIYYVRNTFLHLFGPSWNWWLALILILLSTMTFELAVKSLFASFFTTDEDVFRVLEKDPEVKRRLEEASANELQNGWDRTTNKERDEQKKVEEAVRKVKEREEQRREREVEGMLRDRARTGSVVDGGDVDRVLSRGFGDVRAT